jgi:predicted Holliday junction resolvase-like endonuclease
MNIGIMVLSAWFVIIKPTSHWFIMIIIVGLGWGLVCNVLSQYLRKGISELSQDDLLNAMKIVKELQKKVEDQRVISKHGEFIIREKLEEKLEKIHEQIQDLMKKQQEMEKEFSDES